MSSQRCLTLCEANDKPRRAAPEAPDEDAFNLKWNFEILPLLDEYFKDGIINRKWKTEAR